MKLILYENFTTNSTDVKPAAVRCLFFVRMMIGRSLIMEYNRS